MLLSSHCQICHVTKHIYGECPLVVQYLVCFKIEALSSSEGLPCGAKTYPIQLLQTVNSVVFLKSISVSHASKILPIQIQCVSHVLCCESAIIGPTSV